MESSSSREDHSPDLLTPEHKSSDDKTPLLEPALSGLPDYSSVKTIQNDSQSASRDVPAPIIRTYWWRWVVLAVFSLNLAMTNIIWIPSAPIANVVTCYYGVTDFWVNALSEVYMLTYTLFLFPVAWLLDRYGLRLCLMLGAAADAAGAALKLAGTGPSYFWLLMFGQTLASLANITVWTAAPLLSEVWFPAGERATATAVGGAIAPQMGILIGLGLTPFIVHSDEVLQFAVCGNATVSPFATPDEQEEWSGFIFSRMLYFNAGVAGLGIVVLLLTIFAFPNAPPTPPSISRQLESEHKGGSGCQQLKEFVLSTLGALKNVYFLLYMLVAGVMIAIGGAVVSVLNEVIHPYFPDHDEDIGYLGITAQTCSLFAMLIAGRILDWTKAFYIVNLSVCVLSTICVALWAVLIQYQTNFYLLYIPAVLYGLSMASFQAVAYEYAIEMTYPLAEGTSAGLLNLGSQVLSIASISFVGQFVEMNKVPVGLWFLLGLTALGTVIAIFVRPELRRVKIDSSAKKRTSA